MPGIAEQQRQRLEMLKRDQRRREIVQQRNEFDRIKQEERRRRVERQSRQMRNARPIGGERQLMEEMLRQSPPLIRGMNSETRIDMLKPPKFRK